MFFRIPRILCISSPAINIRQKTYNIMSLEIEEMKSVSD